MSKDNTLDIKKMDNQHLVNRIAWCKRQVIDTWQIHGDEPKYGAGGGMDSMMNDHNNRLEQHIKRLEVELDERELEL